MIMVGVLIRVVRVTGEMASNANSIFGYMTRAHATYSGFDLESILRNEVIFQNTFTNIYTNFTLCSNFLRSSP